MTPTRPGTDSRGCHQMTTEPVFSVVGEGAAATLQSPYSVWIVMLAALLALHAVNVYLDDVEGLQIWQ